MRQNFHCRGVLSFLIFLIVFSQASARFLPTKQGEKMVDLGKSINSSEGSFVHIQNNDSFNELMGMEDCGTEEEEECLKRRVVAEAHLDYIYTQRHKP